MSFFQNGNSHSTDGARPKLQGGLLEEMGFVYLWRRFVNPERGELLDILTEIYSRLEADTNTDVGILTPETCKAFVSYIGTYKSRYLPQVSL